MKVERGSVVLFQKTAVAIPKSLMNEMFLVLTVRKCDEVEEMTIWMTPRTTLHGLENCSGVAADRETSS
jgi:hypothetical protein